MLEIVLAVLLTAHLLLVDVAMAGPLVSVWLEWRAGRRAEQPSDALARRLAVLSLWALAGGSILGGVLLGIRYLADDRAYFVAVAAIPQDRIWFSLAELLFSFVCLGAYVALWTRWRGRRVLHRLLALGGASNLLIHFPTLFAVIAVVSARPEFSGEALDRAGYRRLLIDGEVLSRVTHVWLAAAAVTGIVVVALAMRTSEATLPNPARERHLKGGARLALAATLLQFPVGVWVVLEMSEAAREPLMGGDWLATGLFLIALLFSVQLLHLLSAIALGDTEARQVRRSVAVMTVLVLLMVGTRLRLNGQAESVTLTAPLSITPGAALPSSERGAVQGFVHGAAVGNLWTAHGPCVNLRLRLNRGT